MSAERPIEVELGDISDLGTVRALVAFTIEEAEQTAAYLLTRAREERTKLEESADGNEPRAESQMDRGPAVEEV